MASLQTPDVRRMRQGGTKGVQEAGTNANSVNYQFNSPRQTLVPPNNCKLLERLFGPSHSASDIWTEVRVRTDDGPK
eukprot:4572131-Alexandrium_andersonii.AAC.1